MKRASATWLPLDGAGRAMKFGRPRTAGRRRARIVDVRPDLMLVDWMLPDMSGLELTRSLKRAKDTEEIPVIMLTARAEEQDKVGGLEGGADDYITKPFSPRELLARIQAVLRRAAPAGAADTVEVEGLKLDDSANRVSAGRARNRAGTDGIPLAPCSS